MAKTLSGDFLTRIEENRRLYERPGWGGAGSRFWSMVGLHAFWWLLGISFIVTWLWLGFGQHNQVNNWLFGWLYQ